LVFFASTSNDIWLSSSSTGTGKLNNEIFGIVYQVSIASHFRAQMGPGISAAVTPIIAHEGTAFPADFANQVVDFPIHGLGKSLFR